MRNRIAKTFLIVFVSLTPTIIMAQNATTENLSNGDHWYKLFNGKNLDGWEVKCTSQDKDKHFWTVDSGTILCNSLGSTTHQYIWLQTIDEFDDFELRLKYQIIEGQKGNSGVQFRSRYFQDDMIDDSIVGWLDGPQADIDIRKPWRTGLIYDETRETRRWINPSLPGSKISLEVYTPSGEVVNYYKDEAPGWNEMTILCKGNHIKTIVNNNVVSDYDGSGVLDDEIHKKQNVGTKGHIALQLHKKSPIYIRFKDIEIRSIK